MNILRMALLSVALTLGASVVSAQQPGAQKSLDDRLGGLKGITVVVDDFINRLVAHKELIDIVGTTKADIVTGK